MKQQKKKKNRVGIKEDTQKKKKKTQRTKEIQLFKYFEKNKKTKYRKENILKFIDDVHGILSDVETKIYDDNHHHFDDDYDFDEILHFYHLLDRNSTLMYVGEMH